MNTTRPPVAPTDAGEALSQRLRTALGNAYGVIDCKKALAVCDNDLTRAADWLVAGQWRQGRLIRWDTDALRAGIEALQAEFPEKHLYRSECLEVLQDCGGSLELARRKLKGLSPLQA